jgi:PLD-like domain
MQALKRAADRGVRVDIYLDGTQFAEREPTRFFEELAHARGFEIRVKRENSAFMHLKSYETEGQLLRTGAANFRCGTQRRGGLAGVEPVTPGRGHRARHRRRGALWKVEWLFGYWISCHSNMNFSP